MNDFIIMLYFYDFNFALLFNKHKKYMFILSLYNYFISTDRNSVKAISN